MIVRDESAIIERCLESVLPWVDCYVILDTGSTDETPAIIASFFSDRGVPGEVHLGRFIDFSTSRNEALELAEAAALDYDYVLFIDADMELQVADPAWKRHLCEPFYSLRQHNILSYDNIRLVRRGSGARYVGVTHEYLDTGGRYAPRLEGVQMLDHACGANREGKAERDAALLLRGLEAEPDNARYLFYLAQSYRDANQLRKAYATYSRRVAAGGWEEEQFMAQLEKGRIAVSLGEAEEIVVRDLLDAFDLRPTRAEPLHALAAYFRSAAKWGRAYLFARMGVQIPRPGDRLFVHNAVYDWMLLDELGVAAYWVGQYRESKNACEAILERVGDGLVLDPATLDRISQNLAFAESRLGEPG
jgi:glycosyltransferase involved in cell wall biosynthesis